MLASCNFTDRNAVSAHIAPQVVASLAGDVSGIENPSEPPLRRVEVYVDLSYSMQPFLAGGDETRYYQFLDGLYNGFGADRVAFHGFGYERGEDTQSVSSVPVSSVLSASSYTLLNNDYASLFETFQDKSATHLVVSDGVQSDRESGGQIGGIIGAARQWIVDGGVFATLLYRSPYAGTYYPEAAACTATRVPFECPDRPFVVFAFAPSAGALDRTLAVLGSTMPPEHVVRVGGSSVSTSLVSKADPPPGERRPERLLRSVEPIHLQHFQPIEWASVDTRSVRRNNGFMPLQFDVRLSREAAPWKQMTEGEKERFFTGLRPRLDAWVYDPRENVLDSVSVFQRLDQSRMEWRPAEGDSLVVARITVPVQRPATRGRYFAWVLTLDTYENAGMLVPSGYSTEVDCTNDTCSRTLNLAPLLGAILRDLYIPGRQLFVTEWRS